MNYRRVTPRDVADLEARVERLHHRRDAWRDRTASESYTALLCGDAVAQDIDNIYEEEAEKIARTLRPHSRSVCMPTPTGNEGVIRDVQYIVGQPVGEPVGEATRARVEECRRAPNPYWEESRSGPPEKDRLQTRINEWLLGQLAIRFLDRHEIEMRTLATKLSEPSQTTPKEDIDLGPSMQELREAYEETYGHEA